MIWVNFDAYIRIKTVGYKEEDIDDIEMRIHQIDEESFTLTGNRINWVQEDEVIFYLSKDESNKLNPNKKIQIQIIPTISGSQIPTPIIYTNVADALERGVVIGAD